MPFIYPNNFKMTQIMPDLMARGREGRVGLDILPPTDSNFAEVRWIQKDNYYGLQQFRGLGGEPVHVLRVGLKTYTYEPGVFGEYIDINEIELVKRAGSAPIDTTPINVDDLVVEADEQLIGREYDRMEASIWSILTTGTLSLSKPGPNNSTIAYTDTYAIQNFTATVPWGTVATATPIQNFQAVQQLQLGRSVDFGAGATSYANNATLNKLLNNQNNADFNGRRTQFGATVNNLKDVASYWQAQNLPKLVGYDDGYFATIGQSGASQFTKFIPDNTVVVVGKRPAGALVGEYQLTRNASNGLNPGSYRYLLDRINGVNGEKRTPANIEVHRGHNGGPVIYYPSAIVVMHV